MRRRVPPTINQYAGGDFHDFASSGEVYDKAPEVQDANGYPAASSTDFSQQPTNGPAEVAALHAIGYNFVNTVPEPGTYALFGSLALTGAAFLKNRKSRK